MAQNLIVVGFHGKQRASEVLGQLEQVTADWALDLKDAVAAYRTDDGRLRIDQSLNPTTKEGAGYGVFLGTMIGALLAAPFRRRERSQPRRPSGSAGPAWAWLAELRRR
jgi:uncharacterized membrane protein